MRDQRFTTVVFPHPVRDVPGVSDKGRRPLCRAAVPSDEPRDNGPRERGEAEAACVPFVIECEPAHRMDVTDVHGVRAETDALSPRGRRADYYVEGAQVETFEGR